MAKPAVDRLTDTLQEQGVAVISLSAVNGLGRTLAGRYAIRGVPTLLVLDSEGQPTLRQVGRINQEAALEAVAALTGN